MGSGDEMKTDEHDLAEIEADEARVRAKTFHHAFTDAKRVISLADEEECLDRKLRHEKERQVST